MLLEIDCKGTVDLNITTGVYEEELDMSQSNTCSYLISKNLEYLRFVGYHQRQTVARHVYQDSGWEDVSQ